MVVGAKSMRLPQVTIQMTKLFSFTAVVATMLLLNVEGLQAQLGAPAWRVTDDRSVFDSGDDEGSEEVVGAVLKTDPDLEALMERANRHANEENYSVATRLWQAVLEGSGDSLSSDDDKIFYSMGDRVEKLLASLPKDALDIYRVRADAAAKELLKQGGEGDVTALTRVTSNYFPSSVGDDAAFELSSIYLDRYDFTGALRVLRKIVDHHPDPSVRLEEVWARIALCHAFLGNAEQATVAIKAGKKLAAESSAIDAVERSLGNLQFKPKQELALGEWTLPLGSQSRMAAMLSLPESAFDRDQISVWQFLVEPSERRIVSRPNTQGKVLVGDRASGEVAASSRNSVERRMIKKWQEEGWRPAGELLFDDERVFFKGPGDLVAFDRSAIPTEPVKTAGVKGDSRTELKAFASWRSLWRNVFLVDDATTSRETMRGAFGGGIPIQRRGTRQSNSNTVSMLAKSLYFEDRIHHQMAIHDGILYTVEGTLFGSRSSRSVPDRRHNYMAMRRTRNNFLSAYEQGTGRMLWRLPRVDIVESPSYEMAMYDTGVKPKNVEGEESPWLTSGGVMGSPLKFGDILILPVNKSGAIHLYGVDPLQEGKTLWSCFLCDDPESGSVPTSPINMSLDGSDVLVTCGTGVVFLVDPSTGKVRFAKRYSRRGRSSAPVRRHTGSVSMVTYNGWSSDSVLPNGRELICFCSDTDTVTAIDRNSGEIVWRRGLSPYGAKLDYIIGAYDRKLFLGGQRTVMAIALDQQGRAAWGGEPHFGDEMSYGRAMVTPQGVFVPVNNSIWRFALDGKNGRAKVLNQIEVFLGTEAPVGNLYSDGERIWVRGATRLYALSPKPYEDVSDAEDDNAESDKDEDDGKDTEEESQ